MKYILDKNALTNSLINNVGNRNDLCVTEEVLVEAGLTKQEITNLKKAGIQVLKLSKKHFDKLIEIMSSHGRNLKLINLYGGKGAADVCMIAYATAERDNPETLFAEDYTIVTNDKELTTTARLYGINCIQKI